MARLFKLLDILPGLGRSLRYFWPWIAKERALITTSLGALCLGILMKLAEPWPLAFILDRFIKVGGEKQSSLPFVDGLEDLTLLTVMSIAVVVFTSLRAVTGYYQRMGFAKVGNRVLLKVREHLYVHLQKLSLSFHTKARGGDLTVRVTRDVSMLRDVTSTALIPLFANLMFLVGMVGIMFVMEWRLTLLAMLTAPFFWLSTIKIGKGIHGAARKQRQREGLMASTAAESMAAIKVVQALSLEDAFSGEFATSNTKSQKEDMLGQRLAAKLERTVDILLAIATALVLWYGAYLVMGGRMSPGKLTVFLFYLKRAFKPAKDFAKYTGRLAKATAASDRVLAVLQETPDVLDLPHAKPAPAFKGAVTFEGLSFGYEENKHILAGLDLKIPPGTFFALVGPSGIGKSTLVSLIMRLYDPRAGRVCIDGQDIRDYTLASLRRQISVVLQDTVLFAATVRENISIGARDATPEKILAAARLANAHEFISALPEGYETMVGERGANLSNGQRQRIAIARAAMRGAPILILDEPTTGLDEENEREVLAALKRLAKGHTTFLITHDLELAAQADLVGYLEGGRLVECGPPAKLLQGTGRYRQLHSLQTDRGKPEGAA